MELVPRKLYFYLDSIWRESNGRLTGDLIVCLDSSQKHVKSVKHFGPPLLKSVWEHCDRVDKTRKNGRVFFLTNDREDNLHTEQRTISAFLMAAYAILRLDWDVNTANDTLLESIPAKLAFFRDYHGESNFKLNIADCLRGLYIGCRINHWFPSRNSTIASKIFDMDWIVPNKLLALRDPTVRREKRSRSVSKVALRELKRCGISSIVRLNGNDHVYCLDYYGYSYEAEDVKKEHFLHYDIPFEDVSIPSFQQVNQFIEFCEVCNARVAVHCHAGLGRSAVMIGCYMIKYYGFDARSVCSWMKMCRSGSVMGPQHFFFEGYVKYLKSTKGTVTRKEKPKHISKNILEGAPGPSRHISRPPRKNNIIHIVPTNKREMRKLEREEKVDKKQEVKEKEPRKSKKAPTSVTAKSPIRSSVKHESKQDGRAIRMTPTSKWISTIMRGTHKISYPQQSLADSVLEPRKIQNCYVKMVDLDLEECVKLRGKKGRRADSIKGPSLMKGKVTKSHDAISSVKPVAVSASHSWSQRTGQRQNGVVTRSMGKQRDAQHGAHKIKD